MEIIIERITEEIKPVYLNSTFYTHTIWDHVLCVSKFAKDFAEKMGSNQFIAEAGGLLHDLGAAKYGQKDHHITGTQEAV
ncbi:MAG: HDIG domain-containing metalloprotein, partial [bacterium]